MQRAPKNRGSVRAIRLVLILAAAEFLGSCSLGTRSSGQSATTTTFEWTLATDWNVAALPSYVDAVCLEYELEGRFVPADNACDAAWNRSLRMDGAPSSVCLAFYETWHAGVFYPGVSHRFCLAGVPSGGSVRIKDLTCSDFACDAAEVVSTPPGVKVVRPPTPRGSGITVSAIPNGMTFAGGSLWLSTHSTVFRIDPERRGVVDSVSRHESLLTPQIYSAWPYDLATAATAGAVWVADEVGNTVLRLDPKTAQVMATIAIDVPVRVLAGDGDPWVLQVWHGLSRPIRKASLSRIDPNTNRVAGTIPLSVCVGALCGDPPGRDFSIAIGEGAVWVCDFESTVYRIAPDTGAVVAKISVSGAASVAVARGTVWVANNSGRLFRIDPRTNSVIAALDEDVPKNRETETYPGVAFPSVPVIVVDGDSVWIVGSEQMSKVDSKTSRIVATMPSYEHVGDVSALSFVKFRSFPIYRLPAPHWPGVVLGAAIDRDVMWLLRADTHLPDSMDHAAGGIFHTQAWMYGLPTGSR